MCIYIAIHYKVLVFSTDQKKRGPPLKSYHSPIFTVEQIYHFAINTEKFKHLYICLST